MMSRNGGLGGGKQMIPPGLSFSTSAREDALQSPEGVGQNNNSLVLKRSDGQCVVIAEEAIK